MGLMRLAKCLRCLRYGKVHGGCGYGLEKAFAGVDSMKMSLSLTPRRFVEAKVCNERSGFCLRRVPFRQTRRFLPRDPRRGIEASASRAGKGFAEMGVSIGESFPKRSSEGRIPSFEVYRFEQVLEKASALEIRASFLNVLRSSKQGSQKKRPNLFVRKISLSPGTCSPQIAFIAEKPMRA